MCIEKKRELVNKQIDESMTTGYVTCECGRVLSDLIQYRCLYCSVVFCATCAEKHFGMTREEYKKAHPEEFI